MVWNKDNMLLPTITPKELLEHLAHTYSQGHDNYRHMEAVEMAFKGSTTLTEYALAVLACFGIVRVVANYNNDEVFIKKHGK